MIPIAIVPCKVAYRSLRQQNLFLTLAGVRLPLFASG